MQPAVTDWAARHAGSAACMLLAACAGSAVSPVAPRPAATAPPAATVAPAAPAPRPSLPITRADAAPRRSADPAVAFARGWMPLEATGIPDFLSDHPTHDGRGVLIAILDSGIDPAVPGLDSTSTGERKLLDLRDFSGEGRVALEAFIPAGDTVPAAQPLLGGHAVRALSPEGPWYVGQLDEARLGTGPAADLDGDGDALDTLPVVVARDSAGWFVLADTDLDGSLAAERPVRDFAVAGTYFGWARYGAVPGAGLAVNLAERNHEPVLNLVFDANGHGTHVAGIAAGRRIYGIAGFDGVAPGAQLLGLKIARGSISTTGSMRDAIAHAVAAADALGLPLVINLSFGVGNEREGAARIDAIIDSVLAVRPDVSFVISAGNDGPGLSTVGFPGSARGALTVGATFPRAFIPTPDAAPEARRDIGGAGPVAAFSARGGELAKPDLVVPGIAYSTVPHWNAGHERSGGTSMAAPHAAGLLALLRSGAAQSALTADAADLRAALLATARPIAGAGVADAGAGLADVTAAWRWLAAGHHAPDVAVRAAGSSASAVLHSSGPASPAPRAQVFDVVRPAGAAPAVYQLQSDADWLIAPAAVTLGGGRSQVTVRYDVATLGSPGVRTAVVSAWQSDPGGHRDSAAGPAFRLVNTVVTAHGRGSGVDTITPWLAPGALARIPFLADTGRAFTVAVAGAGAPSAFLHEPGGRPYRDGHARTGASTGQPVLFEVDAADAERGTYEVVVAAPVARAAQAQVTVRHAPVRTALRSAEATVQASVTAAGTDSVAADVMVLLVGAEQLLVVSGAAGVQGEVAFRLPEWASRATVELRQSPEQWARLTDFGATIFSADGSVLEQVPLNYALGHVALTLEPGSAATRAVLRLEPALADPADTTAWQVAVAIRAYAAAPVALAPLDPAATGHLELAAGETATIDYPRTGGPWPLGAGFHPLAVLVAESGGAAWSREVRLAEPAPTESR